MVYGSWKRHPNILCNYLLQIFLSKDNLSITIPEALESLCRKVYPVNFAVMSHCDWPILRRGSMISANRVRPVNSGSGLCYIDKGTGLYMDENRNNNEKACSRSNFEK